MILVEHAVVVTMDPTRRIFLDGSVLIDGERIVQVGQAREVRPPMPPERVINGRGHLVLPGFIDTHVHLSEHLSRGLIPDDVPVDRWQVCHFLPPSHIMIEVGVAHAGKGGYNADPKDKVSSIVVDFLTPETETSMWYFWGMARNFNPKDKALTAQIREGQGKVFAEDTAVLEAQHKNLLKYPDRKLLMLNIDAGGVQSRRIIDRLIAAEQPQKLVA